MYSDEQIRQIILDVQNSEYAIREKASAELQSTQDTHFINITLKMLEDDEYEPVRAAIIALELLSNFNPPQFLARVSEFLDVPNHCASAIWFIWRVGDASYVPRLMSFLIDKDSNVRYMALTAISHFGYHDLLEIALHMINDENSEIRFLACRIISSYSNDNRVFDVLVSKLHDSGESGLETVGSSIAERLGKTGDKRAIQPLINAVRCGHDRLACRALLALRDMQFKSLQSLCLEQIKNKNESLRRGIISILSEDNNTQFTDVLISIAHTDLSTGVQACAIGALKEIGTPKALAVVDKWMEEHRRE